MKHFHNKNLLATNLNLSGAARQKRGVISAHLNDISFLFSSFGITHFSLSRTSRPHDTRQPTIEMFPLLFAEPVTGETSGYQHMHVLRIAWIVVVEIVAAFCRREDTISVDVKRLLQQVSRD